MIQIKIPTCFLFYWLLVSALLLPVAVSAQQFPASGNPGETVAATLTVSNSIVWDNVFESQVLPAHHNLVNTDPLFLTRTDFALQLSSPAIKAGDNANNPGLYDLAGAPIGDPINIGAYENTVKHKFLGYEIEGNGSLLAYIGNKALVAGEEYPKGTEIVVVAIAEDRWVLNSLTANNLNISNGEVYRLGNDVTFEAIFTQGSQRPIGYATAKDRGNLNIHNTIIYDNADPYGTYALDNTNMTLDPGFASRTAFALAGESAAKGTGNAAKLPSGAIDIKGATIAGAGTSASIDAGAYQQENYKLGWDSFSGGTIRVQLMEKDEADQYIPTRTVTSGEETYSPGTRFQITVAIDGGYVLENLTANGNTLTVTNGKTILVLGANTTLTAVFSSIAGGDKKAVAYQKDGETLTLSNNVIHQNANADITATCKLFTEKPVATNIAVTAPNLIDIDPSFNSRTSFTLLSSSAAINKGATAVAGEFDLKGNDRLQGSAIDLGAYESSVAEITYALTFTGEYMDASNKQAALVSVTDADGNALVSGVAYPIGTQVKIKVDVTQPDIYEWVGRVKVNDTFLEEGVTEFELIENSSIGLTIRKKQFTVTFSATNGTASVYNGSTQLANGATVGYGTLLTVQVKPDEYHELSFISVNGQHIDGAEQGGGYIVTVSGETTIVANCVPTVVLDDDGEPVDDPDNPGNPIPAPVKGLLVFDLLNAVITAELVDNPGTYVHSGDLLEAGTKVRITISPAIATGYELRQIHLNGVDRTELSFVITIPEEGAGQIANTFIGVRYEPIPVIEPTPEPVTYPVTFTVTGNGTLSIMNGSTTLQSGDRVEAGTVLSLVVSPETGYELTSFKINGQVAVNNGAYTVRAATNIVAEFEKEREVGEPEPNPITQSKITTTVTGSGTITLSGGVESGDWVDNGTEVTVTVKAGSGYELASLQANGADITSGSIVTITENTQIIAVFNKKDSEPGPDPGPTDPGTNPPLPSHYTLTITAGLPAGITMYPGVGSHQLERGINLTLRITVDDRYDGMYLFLKINNEYVMIRKGLRSDVLTYTLINIRENMTISVIATDNPDPDPLGTAEVESGSRIWTESGYACIQTDAPGSVRIITFNGRLVVSQKLIVGENRIPLADGFYIVALSDGTTKKIAVRNF